MLKKVKFLNYQKAYSYSPPQEDCVINLQDIQYVVPADGVRGVGPFVRIVFKNGDSLTCVGKPEDFLYES